MKLQELLNQDLTKLTPEALIIYKHHHQYTSQSVVYAPEILDLGVILLGYYDNPDRVARLVHLGNCLSVAHYLRAPRALKYGRNFANDSEFQSLPAKLRKHLTGEIQDCTMALDRDFRIRQPVRTFNDLSRFITNNSVPYVYLYQDRTWWLLRINGRNETRPVTLRDQVRQLLSKKA